MTSNPLTQLHKHGQSFWFDNIHRSMITTNELDKMIAEDDLRGITSNPSIFEKAITGGNEYDAQIQELLSSAPNDDNRAYFFALAIRDIQDAADKLRNVYDQSNGINGFVSLEVSPDIAHDTDTSIKEAKELFQRLDRPNVMIKIPATKAGIPVIEELTASGISVNATLLFSVERYLEVAKAYIRGLQQRQSRGEPVDHISSVASFFVSRVDSLLDKKLDECPNKQDEHDALHGQIAIVNAKSAYVEYQKLFEGDEFAELAAANANAQRLLWASTGTKNADYSDILYIEELIGPNTVNTIPPATASSFKTKGTVAEKLLSGLDEAPAQFATLKQIGVDVDAAMQQLEDEGVEVFAKSFDNLLQAIGEKRKQLQQSAA
jgi:transaldolase/transaldolase/glucose-6-phosphate isomerase